MSLATTLSLLPAPSRAVVGACLAGFTFDALYKIARPDLALSPLVPYEDEIFQSGTPEASFIVEPLIQPSPRKLRRPIGRRAVKGLISSRNLAVTLARNEGLALLVVINRFFGELYEEETRAEAEDREPDLPPFPTAALYAAGRRGLLNSATDWAVQLARAGLDVAAVRCLSSEASTRLLKDLRSSAARKAARMSPHVRAYRVFRTALWSEATLFAADVIVSIILEAYRAIQGALDEDRARERLGRALDSGAADAGVTLPAPRRSARRIPRPLLSAHAKRSLRRFATRSGLHILRGCVVLVAVSAGNGLGSTSPVARSGITFLATQGASMAANTFMAGIMSGTLKPRAPPSPPPPAGEPTVTPPPGPVALPGGLPSLPPRPAYRELAGAVPSPPTPVGAVPAPPTLAAPAPAPPTPTAPVPVPLVAATAAAPRRPTPVELDDDAGPDLGAAAEPPVPLPQQRRPAGPRLPERSRRAADSAGRGAAAAPAPATPPSREDRPAGVGGAALAQDDPSSSVPAPAEPEPSDAPAHLGARSPPGAERRAAVTASPPPPSPHPPSPDLGSPARLADSDVGAPE